MSISQVQFITTVQQAGLVNSNIYIHTNPNTPENGKSTILGLAVFPVRDGQINLTPVLEQVERVSFELKNTFPTGSAIIDLTLPITNKAKYVDTGGKIFFYLQTPETVVDVVLTAATQENTIINFEPFITDLLFANNDYNAIINSISDQRSSKYRQVADDNQPYKDNGKTFPLPSNIDALLAGTATEAQIPDSNYTKAGWIRARYEGSTTTAVGYGGVPSYLTGRPFTGSTHVLELPTGSICSIPQGDRILQEFLHTGPTEVPTLVELKEIPGLTGVSITPTDLEIQNVTIDEAIDIEGSYLLLRVFVNSVAEEEIIRAVKYDKESRTLTIERGIEGIQTSQGTIISLRPKAKVRIFRFEGSKVVSISDTQLWVRENPKVIRTDKLGIVFKEDECQT